MKDPKQPVVMIAWTMIAPLFIFLDPYNPINPTIRHTIFNAMNKLFLLRLYKPNPTKAEINYI